MTVKHTEKPILVTADEPSNWHLFRAVFPVFGRRPLCAHHLIYIRMKAEPGIRVVPMYPGRRYIRLLAMLSSVIVWGDESGEDCRLMHHRQQQCGNTELLRH